MYLHEVFPNLRRMSDETVFVHLQFICRIIAVNPEHAQQLKDMMAKLGVIEVDNSTERKRVCDFFYDDVDDDDKLFNNMCQQHEMLPAKYGCEPFIRIFKEIGLQHKMTTALYERFAKEIERESSFSQMSMEMKQKKSKLLVKRLLNERKDIYHGNLKHIKFIYPEKIKSKLVRIHPQFDINSSVSFEESVYPKKDNIYSCWTTAPILPDYATPEHGNSLISTLGIIQKPSKDTVFNHCVNVITKCIHNRRNEEKLTEVMEKIYIQLEDLRFSLRDSFGQQRNIPLIYYPDENKFRKAETVVISCNPEDEIDPYLVKSPSHYGKFNSLFMRIGAADKVTVNMYIKILSALHSKYGSQTLKGEEKACALKAMQKAFLCIKKCHNSELLSTLEDYTLYLLSENGCLENGRNLVVCDNVYLRSRIERGLQLKYMIDLCKLSDVLKMNDIVDGVLTLSRCSAPHILSKIVREEVDMTNVTLELEQDDAVKLQEYIHDEFFITSFCRLTRHTMKEQTQDWNSKVEEKIKASIKKIRCKHVQGIETVLIRVSQNGDQQIENTHERKQVYVATDKDSTALYFEVKHNPNWREDVNQAITVYLNGLIDNCLTNELIFLACRLLSCKTPVETVHILDRSSIEAFGKIPEETYTPCDDEIPVGAYVPQHLHDQLTSDWTEPDVCMALQTDLGIYRYVKVIEPIDCDYERRFKVDIGEECPIEVPASKLFAFRKQSTETFGHSVSVKQHIVYEIEREPVHAYKEASKWQRQAKSDLESAKESFRIHSIPSNWVLYQAHQAAEKSLKAAWYAKDARQVENSHSLSSPAYGLNEEMVKLAREVENITGHHTRMRYPDTMSGEKIPAEYYTRDEAEKGLEIATKILEEVDREFITRDFE